jgi:predicted CoA-binding protein
MSDQELKTYLSRAKTIAVLGAHKDPSRPAHYVPRYLLERGYRILPVNPRFAGEELFGEKVAASLLELQSPVDILDVFRPGEALMAPPSGDPGPQARPGLAPVGHPQPGL